MNDIRTALKLLPESQPSLKVCRLPPYHLDCSQLGRTRVYGNGWSFIIPREVGSGAITTPQEDRSKIGVIDHAACYNTKAAILSYGKRITAGEALTAALLSVYGDWQPKAKPTTRRALVVQLLARQIAKAA